MPVLRIGRCAQYGSEVLFATAGFRFAALLARTVHVGERRPEMPA
jgi:hypothetical protein